MITFLTMKEEYHILIDPFNLKKYNIHIYGKAMI